MADDEESTAKDTERERTEELPDLVHYKVSSSDMPYTFLTGVDLLLNGLIFAILLSTIKHLNKVWTCNRPVTILTMILTVYHGIVMARRITVTVILCLKTDRTSKSRFFIMSLRTFCFMDLIFVPALTIASTAFFFTIDHCKREFKDKKADLKQLKCNFSIAIVYGYLIMPCLAIFICQMAELKLKRKSKGAPGSGSHALTYFKRSS